MGHDFSLILISFHHQICLPWFYTTKIHARIYSFLLNSEKHINTAGCSIFVRILFAFCAGFVLKTYLGKNLDARYIPYQLLL